MKKYKHFFEKYDLLSFKEKLFLRYFCYFPPKPRDKKSKASFSDLHHYRNIYTRAFGEEIWNKLYNKTILDFGCGDGKFVLAMAEKLKSSDIHGIDLSHNVKIGKKYAKEHNFKNTKFYLGSSSSLLPQSYDVIISHDSFEHFEYPGMILSEINRLLKDNGILLIKFGPTWMGPYGRHMSGTIRKDRPWCHLFFSEKTIMRVHSVYHNKKELLEKYKDREGGLNKMTIKKFKQGISNSPFEFETFRIFPLSGKQWLVKLPIFKELFSTGITSSLKKKNFNYNQQ